MPGYNLVEIVTHLETLKAKTDAAKDAHNSNYEGQKGKWDQAVVVTLKQDCTLAESYRKTHAQYVMERRNKCKEIMDGIEAQLKKKDLIAGEYNWIANQPTIVGQLAKE